MSAAILSLQRAVTLCDHILTWEAAPTAIRPGWEALFDTFSAGPCVPALCELHTASLRPALASVQLVYPIARGAPGARGAPCALRPAPRPLWPRPSGPSPRRPRRRPGAATRSIWFSWEFLADIEHEPLSTSPGKSYFTTVLLLHHGREG